MNFKGVEICCPRCQGDLHWESDARDSLSCANCQHTYPVILDIPDLRVFPDPYIDFEPDRDKGRHLAEHFAAVDFGGLIDYYYSVTDVVPPQHAQLYKRGLLAAESRSAQTLTAWESHAESEHDTSDLSLLEIGCGTAPLLVTAVSQYRQVVGIDIAFRWLVAAKKRLEDAGIDAPLICTCAEALPFPDGAFDRVAAESVIETVKDQTQTFAECYRVMRPGGRLFVATPNKFSLGPDPHTGLLAGGYLPKSWTAAYVRKQGGIPPKRKLLSARSCRRLMQQAGFEPPDLFLPNVTAVQREMLGRGLQLGVDVYQTAKRLPFSRQVLHLIGPLLLAVAQRPSVALSTKQERGQP